MTEATLWQWAKDNGYTPSELARALGYRSPRYVQQVLRGWAKLSPAFIGRFLQKFPEHSHIFLSLVSEKDDIISDGNGNGN